MRRRGMVLLGVLVVVAMAALAGTTAMYLAQAELASSRTALKRTQARAMAWSGVQAAMAEMADQREKLLSGQEPELTQRWELFAEEGSGMRGVVRLNPIGEDGPTVVSESARLDLNTATPEMLGALGLDERTAAAIVAARDKSRLASVGDLARVEGFDAKLLEGSATPSRGRAEPEGRGALAGLVTVFSFDPNIQAGLGENGSEHRGKQRVNLHTAWSDRLAAAVDERFGQGASAGLKAMFDKGQQFKTMADVADAATHAGLQVAALPAVFDALTVTDDPYIIGLVDMNHASTEVLAAVPGVSRSAAEQIVQMRDKLDADAKRSVCWPLVQGILKNDEFARAVDHLTTRSMQWRVRVEAGFGTGREMTRSEEAQEALTDRVVLEAVIDVASERPRVAYLRDVTLEAAMATVYSRGEAAEDAAPEAPVSESPAATGPSGPSGPLKETRDLKLSTDLHLSTDLNLTWDKGGAEANMGPAEVPDPIENGSGAASGPTQPPAGGADRRVGRWTSGKGAGG